MEAAFYDDGFFSQLRETEGRLWIRRSHRSGRKHTGEVAEKPCVLQDIVLEFAFRQGSLAQGHDERMGELFVPYRLGKLPQMIGEGHVTSLLNERRR